MSTLDITQIRFLQRIVAEGPCMRASSAAGRFFCSVHLIGTIRGRQFEYTDDDVRHIKDFLAARNLSLTDSDLVGDARDRASMTQYPSVSEKSGSVSPHGGEVAIRALTPGCVFEGEEISSTLPGYRVVHHSEASRIAAEVILVVENFETFKQIHRYRWIYECEMAQGSVLVLFHGDTVFKENHVLTLLHAHRAPVWAFMDFDPAGLGLANRLPRLAGLTFPWEDIESRTRQARRNYLYHDQVGQWGATLGASPHADIQRAWSIIDRLACGLNQEALRSD